MNGYIRERFVNLNVKIQNIQYFPISLKFDRLISSLNK